MKYSSVISIILSSLMFVSCKTPIKQRNIDIASSIKSYVDSLNDLPATRTKGIKIDNIETISIDSISDSKHLDMEIDAIQIVQTMFPDDSTKNNQGLTTFQNCQKEIDSIKAIKTNNQFWGYHVKTKAYLHGVDKTNNKENEMFFFVSKEYKTSLDVRNLLRRLNNH